MNKIGGLILALCTSFLFNCASSDVMHLDSTYRPPKDVSKIEVFLEAPTQEYKIIAVVVASSEGWENVGLEDLKNKLVSEAANLGGDAVIIGTETVGSAGTVFIPIGNTLVGSNVENKKLMGKVIVFKQKN
jgi:hypothetical protein